MLAEENYQFGHFQSAVIASILVNSAVGFLMAMAIRTSVLHLMLQDEYVAPRNWPLCRTAWGKGQKYCTGSLSIFEKPAAWMCALAASHPRADMAQCCFLIVKSNRVSMRRAEHRQSDRLGLLTLFIGGLQPLRLISVWKRKDEICKQSHGIRKPSSFSVALFQEDCHSFLIFKLKAVRHVCTCVCRKEWVLLYRHNLVLLLVSPFWCLHCHAHNGHATFTTEKRYF